MDELGLWTLGHDNFPSCVTLKKDSFILPLCLSICFLPISTLNVQAISLIHVYTKTIFSLRCWSLTHIGLIYFQQRTSIQYILLHHVKFFIAQILFYTPPKPIEIMIFMQKSLLEIMIWVVFWGCIKQCKSLCVQ